VKDYKDAKPRSVTMLGMAAPLRFKSGDGNITVELPELPEDLRAQSAWVLKLSR